MDKSDISIGDKVYVSGSKAMVHGVVLEVRPGTVKIRLMDGNEILAKKKRVRKL
jgi:preprotein translocase subunit YajC